MGDGIVKKVAVIVGGAKEAHYAEEIEQAAEFFSDNGYSLYVATHHKPGTHLTHYEPPTAGGVRRLAKELGDVLDDDDELAILTTAHGARSDGGCLVLRDDCLDLKSGPLKRIFDLPHGNRTVIMGQCYGGNWAKHFSDTPKTLFISEGSKGEVTYCGDFQPYLFAPDAKINDMNGDGAISWQERYAHAASQPQGALTLFIPGSEFVDSGPSGKAKEEPPFDSKVQSVRTPKELEALLAKLRPGDLAFVKVSSPWCEPCKDYAPQFEKFARKAKGKAMFISIPNGDDNRWKYLETKGYPSVFLMDSIGRRTEIDDRYALMQSRWMLTGSQWCVPAYCLRKLREDSRNFSRIDTSLKSDKDFLIDAIAGNALVTKHVSYYLRADATFMSKAVKANAKSFEFAAANIAAAREIALEAVKSDGAMFKFVAKSLTNDREFILAAVSNDGKMLKYAKKEFRDDKEIVAAAVKEETEALRFASQKLRKDRDFILDLVKEDGSAIRYASKKIKKDREVALAAVKKNAFALRHIHPSLRKDREVVIAAIETYPSVVEYAHTSLRADKDIARKVIGSTFFLGTGRVFRCFHKSIRGDRDLAMAAVRRSPSAMEYVVPSLKKDRAFVLEAVKSRGASLEHAHKKLRNDREVVLAAVQQDGKAVQFASDELQKDIKIAAAAIRQNPDAYDFLPVAMQANFQLYRLWLKRGGRKKTK